MYKKTLLPHKTIATKAGIGWIGKNNLFITPWFACSLCIGTVWTDIPIQTTGADTIPPECGVCQVCIDICEVGALKGHSWSTESNREDIITVDKCTTCIKCMVHCPWTHRYIREMLS
ncbi:MAG: hypothetical protein LBG19_10095 [Prevotellaceae bacterium]|nr:hypothetical protein [Prevotellaceae bacterium]